MNLSPIWQNQQFSLYYCHKLWALSVNQEKNIIGIWTNIAFISFLETILIEMNNAEKESAKIFIPSYIEIQFAMHINEIINIRPERSNITLTVYLKDGRTTRKYYLQYTEIIDIHEKVLKFNPKLTAQSMMINGNIKQIEEITWQYIKTCNLENSIITSTLADLNTKSEENIDRQKSTKQLIDKIEKEIYAEN